MHRRAADLRVNLSQRQSATTAVHQPTTHACALLHPPPGSATLPLAVDQGKTRRPARAYGI